MALVWCRESDTSLIPNFFGQSHRKPTYNVWLLIFAGKNLKRALKTVKRQDALPFLLPTVPGLVEWSSAISRPQNCSTCLPTSGTSTSKRGLKKHERPLPVERRYISIYSNKLHQIKVGARKTAVIDFKKSSEAQNFRYSLLRKMSLYWSFYVGKYRFPSQNKIFCRKSGFFMDNFFCFGWYSGQVNVFRENSHIVRILNV